MQKIEDRFVLQEHDPGRAFLISGFQEFQCFLFAVLSEECTLKCHFPGRNIFFARHGLYLLYPKLCGTSFPVPRECAVVRIGHFWIATNRRADSSSCSDSLYIPFSQ